MILLAQAAADRLYEPPANHQDRLVRLGGPLFEQRDAPEAWIDALRRNGYRAAYCPAILCDHPGNETLAAEFVRAAREADIVIAEVGAWSNPISPDDHERRQALRHCQERLALADGIGARCCVNITGSRGTRWAAPHPDNLTPATFDLIVASVREIVDAVKPTRTYYTLETMPWAFPDSAESYLALLRAIDRPRVAVHLDPVNLVNSPQRCYENALLIRECFAKLGPFIKSCHAKDIVLHDRLTVHLDEVRPGAGMLDYRTFLRELAKLDRDTPLMLEHLPNEAEYRLAAEHIRQIAARV
jgi:sugar phosphate isomerase/epimerase